MGTALMIPNTTGQSDLRAERISKIVTGFALQKYKFKQLCMIESSSSWQETYFQESKTELTGSTGSSIKGVPRGAQFPNAEVIWTRKTKRQEKYALEGVIYWEDETTNSISVITRTLLRISRGVAKAVDDEIWEVISEGQTPSLINSLDIAAGAEWDSDSVSARNPIQNILDAIKEIEVDNYEPHGGNGFLVVSPKDFANLVGNPNIRNAGQFFTDSATRNGVVGRLAGLTVIKSNSVTADYAMVIVAKTAATWKAAKPLSVVTITDPGIKKTIRAWEVGVTQLTNPEAVCLITNTQK